MEWLTDNLIRLIILGFLIVVTVLFLKRSDRIKKEEDAQKKKYRELTPENLDSFDDGELVNAFVAKRLDAYDESDEKANKFLFTRKQESIITWNREQDNVFFVWLTCMHIKKMQDPDADSKALKDKFFTLTYGELPTIGAAFTAVGAEKIGELFGSITTDSFDENKLDDLNRLVSEEAPIKLCADYIKENRDKLLSPASIVKND